MTIAPVGRNDPCPCGSGKKYKNCCMRKDRLEAARDASVRGEETALYANLAQFVIQPRYAAALGEGISIFWRGQYPPEAGSAIDSEGTRRMIEWFVIDYRYGPNRERLIDTFIETEGPRLIRPVQDLMRAWADSRMGLFRYIARKDEERLTVFEPLLEAETVVRSRLLAQNARPGDILAGRVYTLEGEPWLTSATLVLPREFEQPMVDYARNAQRRYLDEHPGTTMEQFLRANGHIFNAFMLSDRAESLRSLIGSGTRFVDPAVVRDRMREITREQQRQQAARELATPDDLQPQALTRRSAGGIILPGAEEPHTEGDTSAPQRPTILIPGRDV